MSEIQRYTITSFLDGVENIKGEYVKLSDHEKAVRELKEDVVNLKVERNDYKKQTLYFQQQVAEQKKEIDAYGSYSSLRKIAELELALIECGKALNAKDDLLVCYRLGKRPTDELFKRLEKAKELLSKLPKSIMERING